MNKKLLCAALLAGLGLAGAASAQTFDNRWYVSGSVGVNVQDTYQRLSNVCAEAAPAKPRPVSRAAQRSFLFMFSSFDRNRNYI